MVLCFKRPQGVEQVMLACQGVEFKGRVRAAGDRQRGENTFGNNQAVPGIQGSVCQISDCQSFEGAKGWALHDAEEPLCAGILIRCGQSILSGLLSVKIF